MCPNNQPQTGEKRIRRAAAACYRCHWRKVRCDAAVLGYPCTNCTLDGVADCTLRPNTTARFNNLRKASGEIRGAKKSHQATPPQIFSTGLEDLQHTAEATRLLPSSSCPNVAPQTEPALEFDLDVTGQLPGLYDVNSTELSLAGTGPTYPGPDFLDLDRLSSLPMSVVHILATNRCLDIPPRPALDVFVQKYFLLLHPLVPILDEAQFWSIYLQPSKGPGYGQKMSLFVFQAMLLASCAFVPTETVQQCGFRDVSDARRVLHNQAKVLYDTNFESDPLARAQGAVLLTYHTSAEDPQATMTWNLCAIQNATAAGLVPSLPDNDPDTPAKKRLWWSVFVRDKILSLGRHRPAPLISANFTVGIGCLDEHDFEDEIMFSSVYTPEVKRLLVRVFRAQCRLALILTDVIATAFSGSDTYVSRLSAEELRKRLARIGALKDVLARWREEDQVSLGEVEGPRPETVDTLNHITSMHFQSARMALAHHEILLVETHQDLIRGQLSSSLLAIAQDLKDSVSHITKTMAYFSSKNLTESIPLSILAYCGTPMILSAIDLKLSPSYADRTPRRRVLDNCSEVIKQSRGIYDVTEFFSQGTNHILQLAYAITKNLFIERNMEQNNDSAHNLSGRLDPYCADGPDRALVPAFKGLQIKSWVEAFLKYPRAYLLLSTCIDHSLATGRLPRDEVLPPLVRATLYVILGSPKLPWTVHLRDARAEKTIEEGRELRRRHDNAARGSCLDNTWYPTLLDDELRRVERVEPGYAEEVQTVHADMNMDPPTQSYSYGNPMDELDFLNVDPISGDTDFNGPQIPEDGETELVN